MALRYGLVRSLALKEVMVCLSAGGSSRLTSSSERPAMCSAVPVGLIRSAGATSAPEKEEQPRMRDASVATKVQWLERRRGDGGRCRFCADAWRWCGLDGW